MYGLIIALHLLLIKLIQIGYARNVQIYIDSLNAKETIEVDSDFFNMSDMQGTSTTKLGTNGKTFSDSKIEVIKSQDLKEHLKSRTINYI